MDRCIPNRNARGRRAAWLALVFATTAAGAAHAAGKRSDLDVAALLPRLPVEVFDNTTEGIDDEELRVLRQRGQSENWKIGRKSPDKLVFVAKRPFSEVNLRPVRDGSQTFIEALTFNEKAISYGYFIARDGKGPLESHEPGAVFRLFNEREDGGRGIASKDAPKAIVAHAQLREQCVKASKASGAAKDKACEDLPAKAAQLRQEFSKEPRWVAIIERIGKVVGE